MMTHLLDLFLGQQRFLAVEEVVDYKSCWPAGLASEVEESTSLEIQACQNKDSSARLEDGSPNEKAAAHCDQEAVFATDRCFRL